MPDLASISLGDLHDSPNQPRVSLNRETIEGFKTAIERADGFPKDAAITVRPRRPAGYEIIAGHHRIAAARAVGLTHAWAFVRDLDDKAAMIELVTSNNHTAMTPLEHGRAAIALKEQGVYYYEYARMTGKANSQITCFANAYKMIQEYGGANGPYADISPVVLESAGRIGDKDKRDATMFVLNRDQPSQAVAMDAIRLVKGGECVTKAFKAAKAIALRKWQAARQVRNDAAAADAPAIAAANAFGQPGIEAGALSAYAAASYTNGQLAFVMNLATFQAAQLAEYAARFGPLPDDGSVQRRMEALRAEGLADESPADDRGAA